MPSLILLTTLLVVSTSKAQGRDLLFACESNDDDGAQSRAPSPPDDDSYVPYCDGSDDSVPCRTVGVHVVQMGATFSELCQPHCARKSEQPIASCPSVCVNPEVWWCCEENSSGEDEGDKCLDGNKFACYPRDKPCLGLRALVSVDTSDPRNEGYDSWQLTLQEYQGANPPTLPPKFPNNSTTTKRPNNSTSTTTPRPSTADDGEKKSNLSTYLIFLAIGVVFILILICVCLICRSAANSRDLALGLDEPESMITSDMGSLPSNLTPSQAAQLQQQQLLQQQRSQQASRMASRPTGSQSRALPAPSQPPGPVSVALPPLSQATAASSVAGSQVSGTANARKRDSKNSKSSSRRRAGAQAPRPGSRVSPATMRLLDSERSRHTITNSSLARGNGNSMSRASSTTSNSSATSSGGGRRSSSARSKSASARSANSKNNANKSFRGKQPAATAKTNSNTGQPMSFHGMGGGTVTMSKQGVPRIAPIVAAKKPTT